VLAPDAIIVAPIAAVRDLPKKVKLLCEELLVFREPIVR
jgi:hypothetical protein